MACDCDSVCPEAGSCGCIEVISSGLCRCTCKQQPIFLEPLAPLEEISLNTRDLELWQVAELFRLATDSEILVPASRLRETFTESREKTTLEEAMKEFGLLATGSPPEGDGAYLPAA